MLKIHNASSCTICLLLLLLLRSRFSFRCRAQNMFCKSHSIACMDLAPPEAKNRSISTCHMAGNWLMPKSAVVKKEPHHSFLQLPLQEQTHPIVNWATVLSGWSTERHFLMQGIFSSHSRHFRHDRHLGYPDCVSIMDFLHSYFSTICKKISFFAHPKPGRQANYGTESGSVLSFFSFPSQMSVLSCHGITLILHKSTSSSWENSSVEQDLSACSHRIKES